KAGDAPAAARPAKPPKPARKLAGDKQARTDWKPEDEALSPAPVPAAPVPSIDNVGDQSAQPALAEQKPQSVIRRHGKAILLGVSIVVLSLLTLNLISQRMAADRAAPRDAAPPGDTGALTSPLSGEPVANLSALPKAARVIPMVDSLATASIDPAAAKGFEPSTEIPAMPRAFTSLAEEPQGAAAAAEQVASPPPLAASVAPLSDAIAPAMSPVKVEPPPETLGPEALRQSAANGDPRAQFEIAAIYTEGRAVPEDLEAAAMWYERAAAQGFAPAQYRLGNLYENGRGVEKDLEQARLWYQRAAEAGNRMSMHNLAALYAGGEMGEQKFDSAAEWFEQAARRGLKDSQFNLGMLHARGLGVPQDLEQSYKWFSIAAKNGDTDAAKARDDIARSLDAEAVGRLNAEVAAWKSAPIDLPANFAPIGAWSEKFDPGETIANQDVVKSVQMALAMLGYDVGAPDGLAGPKTAEAIKSFERATGMSESGAINPRLLAVLGSQPV
ncbi:MAG: peptidoglycan-binding protein, partial [Devosia sp.]